MVNIGSHLLEARKRRGLTLRQIADSTKLSSSTLRYMERNAFDRLPGGIFTKGYLRAYAAEVGLDPEEMVDSYLTQFPEARLTEALPIVPSAPIKAVSTGRHFLTAVVVIVVALVAYGSLRNSSESPIASSVEPASAPVSIELLETGIVALGAAPAIRRDEEGLRNEGGLYLEIQPSGACWVSAVADGRLVVYRLLQRGERVTVIAHDELVLRVGDPEVFAYVLNGVSGRPLGEAGKPVTVRIDENNYQTFLAAPAPTGRATGSAGTLPA